MNLGWIIILDYLTLLLVFLLLSVSYFSKLNTEAVNDYYLKLYYSTYVNFNHSFRKS